MKPKGCSGNHRELESFINGWATSCALVSACKWPLFFCYSLERVCPEGLRSPCIPLAYSYVLYWSCVCPSTLVHSCHMASPFPTQTVSHCHEFLCFGSLSYFCFPQSVCRSIHPAVFFVHLPLESLEHLLFLLCNHKYILARWLIDIAWCC